VTYFKKRRVMEYQRDQQMKKLRAEGAQEIPAGSVPPGIGSIPTAGPSSRAEEGIWWYEYNELKYISLLDKSTPITNTTTQSSKATPPLVKQKGKNADGELEVLK
ncbi:hypothetical protein V501_04155, partial [Pseudogymnoascus sp. VKM F-4519 (FW-2642)]